MYPFWILLTLMTEVVVTTGAVRRAKLQSRTSPPTNHYIAFYRPDTSGVSSNSGPPAENSIWAPASDTVRA